MFKIGHIYVSTPASNATYQVHGTGPWLFHLAMSAAGYDPLMTTSDSKKQRGAAEKGSGLALADPHTRTKQNV